MNPINFFRYTALLLILSLSSKICFSQQVFSSHGLSAIIPDTYKKIKNHPNSYGIFFREDGLQVIFSQIFDECALILESGKPKETVARKCFEISGNKMAESTRAHWTSGIKDTTINKLRYLWLEMHSKPKNTDYYSINLMKLGNGYNHGIQISGFVSKRMDDIVEVSKILNSITILNEGGPQYLTQSEFANKFKVDLCDCLRNLEDSDPTLIVYNQMEKCTKLFLNENRENMVHLVGNDMTIDQSLSAQQKMDEWQSKFIMNNIANFINQCETYKNALIEFKKNQIKEHNATPEKAQELITELKQKIPQVDDQKKRAMMYSILALFYEIAGVNQKAIYYYDRSLETYPTTAAKAFKSLIEVSKN